jgi:hypothetical protein
MNAIDTNEDDTPETEMPAYMKEGWPDEDQINRIIEGDESAMPESSDEAIGLIRQRFGAVFRFLPEEMRRDETLLMEAVVESSGHSLRHAPSDVVGQLRSAFFEEAIERGTSDWIRSIPGEMNSASDSRLDEPWRYAGNEGNMVRQARVALSAAHS